MLANLKIPKQTTEAGLSLEKPPGVTFVQNFLKFLTFMQAKTHGCRKYF